jgi:hypothetical protein
MSTGEIAKGDEVTVSFFKGEFTAEVTEIDQNKSIVSRFQTRKVTRKEDS